MHLVHELALLRNKESRFLFVRDMALGGYFPDGGRESNFAGAFYADAAYLHAAFRRKADFKYLRRTLAVLTDERRWMKFHLQPPCERISTMSAVMPKAQMKLCMVRSSHLDIGPPVKFEMNKAG